MVDSTHVDGARLRLEFLHLCKDARLVLVLHQSFDARHHVKARVKPAVGRAVLLHQGNCVPTLVARVDHHGLCWCKGGLLHRFCDDSRRRARHLRDVTNQRANEHHHNALHDKQRDQQCRVELHRLSCTIFKNRLTK